jgi:NAD(P)-dependent dehydrogenase (short-subunit alcohol dehydrogenase family)
MSDFASPRPLAGKVALVTGAGSGIGRASAVAFAHAGASVVVADLDATSGRETTAMIRAGGAEATFCPADVKQSADVARLVAATVDQYGRLDCAHNNAGISGVGGGATHEIADELWARVLAVNLTGVWLCMKHEIAHMLAQGGGAIVNTASVMGLVGGGGAAYVASKHGVVGLTKQAALEYAEAGIRVNAVCPGFVRTAMIEDAFASRPEVEARFRAAHPMARFGEPEEIAVAVVWLCTDAAAFVTGAAMPVDGGYLAR